MTQWYYARDEEQHGPVDAAELERLASSESLRETDLVWCSGMPEWVPASTVAGLFPASLPSTTTASRYAAKRRISNRNYVIAIGAGIGLLVLAMTCGLGVFAVQEVSSEISPSFDSQDVRKTARWAAMILRPLDEIRDDKVLETNAVARKAAWEEAWKVAQTKCGDAVGREIVWSLNVHRVYEKEVHLKGIFDEHGNDAHLKGSLDAGFLDSVDSVKLLISTQKQPPSVFTNRVVVRIGDGISIEKATTLRAGDAVQISGVVQQCQLAQAYANGGSHVFIQSGNVNVIEW